MTDRSRYIWHHQVHEAWASERLYFWRLAFFPTYDQASIRDGLESALSEHEVYSYALYEIYGVYDLVLRVWLPTTTTPERFEEALTAKLSGMHMEVCDVFSVGQILRHWPWRQADGSVKVLDSSILTTRRPQEELSVLNRAAAGDPLPDWADQNIASAVRDGVLAPCSSDGGIKFLVVVTSSSQLATIAARGELRQRLNTILNEAEESGSVTDTSLYEGSGFGQFILLGRIDPRQFSDLRVGVIDRVNAAGTGPYFRARPYTYVTATGGSDNGLAPKFVDLIPEASDATRTSLPIEKLLDRDEDEVLELKGSAFVDVLRWVHSGKAVRDEDITNDGVIKAVVGMLNRAGGTIIVGALEASRHSSVSIEQRRSGTFPEVGKYTCVGVELDYQGKDWDRFALKLQAVIMERIDPPPVGLVTISKVEVAGKALCVLTVHRTSREWFYRKVSNEAPAEFFVRLGNSTQPLSGPLADGYKQSYRRG